MSIIIFERWKLKLRKWKGDVNNIFLSRYKLALTFGVPIIQFSLEKESLNTVKEFVIAKHEKEIIKACFKRLHKRVCHI